MTQMRMVCVILHLKKPKGRNVVHSHLLLTEVIYRATVTNPVQFYYVANPSEEHFKQFRKRFIVHIL